MVVYDLICAREHRFEGWFPSYEGYQEQAEKGQISCPSCGSTAVEKLPHACAVHVKKEAAAPRAKKPPSTQQPAPALSESQVRELLVRLNHYVSENFQDVGPRFAEEARAIFHGEKEDKPIHGTATTEECRELDEDGVPYGILPKPKMDS
ncbi:MAG TPA: DUF1178 family protein [Candidatus Binatia bacterium]